MGNVHRELSDWEVHVPGYVQALDPGAIGAGKVWVDTSGGTGAWQIKVRNANNDGWEVDTGINSVANKGWRFKTSTGEFQLYNPVTAKWHTIFPNGPEGAVQTAWGPGES